jgi:hypothetical protein
LIVFEQKGDFTKTEKFLKQPITDTQMLVLERHGKEGVTSLATATPKDSGKTANSWKYKVTKYKGGAKITWSNSNIVNGVPIAVIIQYGHATRNGGHIKGRDYINPAIKPIFDKISSDLWKEVTK